MFSLISLFEREGVKIENQKTNHIQDLKKRFSLLPCSDSISTQTQAIVNNICGCALQMEKNGPVDECLIFRHNQKWEGKLATLTSKSLVKPPVGLHRKQPGCAVLRISLRCQEPLDWWFPALPSQVSAPEYGC